MKKCKVVLCEFDLCVHNTERKCVATEIAITPYGACDSCLIPDMPDALLKQLKQEHLDKMRARQ